MKCLVVDDSPDDRSVVERVLARSGYRVTCASGGAAALELVSKERFDVALVDLGMPGMTGAETLRALRAKDDKLRLLVVSGFDDKKHVMDALSAGADGYLVRHEVGDRLVHAIQEVVAGKSPMSARVSQFLLQSFRSTQPEVVIPFGASPPPRVADASGEIDLGELVLRPKKR
jgi:DNA-binding NarL/FixJ family response regulator